MMYHLAFKNCSKFQTNLATFGGVLLKKSVKRRLEQQFLLVRKLYFNDFTTFRLPETVVMNQRP